MCKDETIIMEYLDSYGIPSSLRGYWYLKKAIQYAASPEFETEQAGKLRGVWALIGKDKHISGESIVANVRYCMSNSVKAQDIKPRQFIQNGVRYLIRERTINE